MPPVSLYRMEKNVLMLQILTGKPRKTACNSDLDLLIANDEISEESILTFDCEVITLS